MDNEHSWVSRYPEAAKAFDVSLIPAGHMAELVSLAARDYG
jgi:hypothetical protein